MIRRRKVIHFINWILISELVFNIIRLKVVCILLKVRKNYIYKNSSLRRRGGGTMLICLFYPEFRHSFQPIYFPFWMFLFTYNEYKQSFSILIFLSIYLFAWPLFHSIASQLCRKYSQLSYMTFDKLSFQNLSIILRT